jgi:hypothetical protein
VVSRGQKMSEGRPERVCVGGDDSMEDTHSPAAQVSFGSLLGLFWVSFAYSMEDTNSPVAQVSFESLLGLFCLYTRSLLPTQ